MPVRCLLAIAWSVLLAASAWAQESGPDSGAGLAAPLEEAPAVRGGVKAVPFSDEQIASLRHVLETSSDGEERYRADNALIAGYQRAGRVADALKVRGDMIDDNSIGAGRRSLAASSLAFAQALLGNAPRSSRLIARAEALARETTPAELETLPREPAYAFLQAEGEIERRARNRHDIALLKYRDHQDLAWRNFNDASLSDKRRRAAAAELLGGVAEYVRILVQNNRRAEALSYANGMASTLETRADLHARSTDRAGIDLARAIALSSFDDYEAALEAINRSVLAYQKAGVVEHDSGYGSVLRQRIMIGMALQRAAEFQADAQILHEGRAVNPVLAGSFPAEEFASLELATQGRWAAAEEAAGEAMQSYARHQGTDSPFYKYTAAIEMVERLSDAAVPVSLADIRSYVAPLMSTDDDWGDARTRGAYLEDAALVLSMDRLLQMQDAASQPEAQRLAFSIAEVLRLNASQGALADGAARLAASDPALRSLIEAEQEERFAEASSRRSFALAADRLARLQKDSDQDPIIAKRLADDVAAHESELQAAAGKLSSLRRQISQQFPIYRELIAARIPDPATLGAALKPHEAYLDLYAGRAATAAFLVTPDGHLHVWRLPYTRHEAQQSVLALRRSFDAATPPTRPGDVAGFDLNAAADLYRHLLEPASAALKDTTTLYLSASGVLANVPWTVLVTNTPKGLADAAWWLDTQTPVLMPSASAFVLARAHAVKPAALPFEGFADPSFDGADHPATEAVAAATVRERAFAALDLARFDYRQVAPLPETYAETRAIAAALAAPPQSVLRGTAATRTRVLAENLADKRVVVFATHGVLPGEVPGLLKAGLAMSYQGQGLADSILTIDDIVTLRLNADWVVLSACNTGYASGDAGDSISALARGFFAAGAHSLLVTQWSVESDSAKELTVALFQRYGSDGQAGKADALAQTERAMRAGKFGALYTHPYFWGAYTLMGDATRQ